MNNTLGIYFGPQIISIVETKGKQLISNIGILRSTISSGKLAEEKVPEEAKIVNLIKNELKNKKIETKEATVSLSGKDLIIRCFEIPILPHEELESAVNFEVRKFIPFKVEDLVLDFQCRLDKTIKKNRVLFVGIKKEILDKYINLFKELGLKVNSIEYSAFSILRFLKLTDVRERGIIANVCIDHTENDEVNFAVLENGFPLFSRDIILFSEPQEEAKTEDPSSEDLVLEKLKREIRIFLDYYDRTFPLKSISKVYFLMDRDYRLDLETFVREKKLGVQFINFDKFVARYIGKPVPFSLSFIKGYCSSLTKVNIAVDLNLLLSKEKTLKRISAQPKLKSALTNFSSQLKLNFVLPIVGVLLCIIIFLFGVYRILPLERDLKNIIDKQPTVSSVSAQISYDELAAIYSNYKSRINAISDIIKRQVYFSELLNAISRVTPENMWLAELSFNKRAENQIELILRGAVYLEDSSRELELVNKFLSYIKGDPVFIKYFEKIDIVSIERSQTQKMFTTNFVISCRK